MNRAVRAFKPSCGRSFMTAQAPPPFEMLSVASNRATASSSCPSGAIACNGRKNWWTGLTAAHRSFTGVYAFDMHRAGSHAQGTRHCVDPASIGLVLADKPWPGWSRPGTWNGPNGEED
jgi:hypothetical protein